MNIAESITTKNMKSYIYENPIIYTYISWILSPIVFAILPIILFIIFMNNESFFSYDFFTNGLFGMKIFYLFSLVIVVFTSLLLFTALILIIENIYINIKNIDPNKIKRKQNSKKFIFWIALTNILCHLIFILSLSQFNKIGLYLYLLLIGFFISIHVGMMIHAKPHHKLISLVILIPMVIIISASFNTHTSEIIKIGLKQYGVGGDIEIIIQPRFNDKNKIRGKLVLLSPNRIFYKKEGSPFISIVERSRYDVTTIFRNFDDEEIDNIKGDKD